MLETRTYVSMIDDGQGARLGMSYNTIYHAEKDIVLTFQYTNMLFQNTDFTDSQYNITIIALDWAYPYKTEVTQNEETNTQYPDGTLYGNLYDTIAASVMDIHIDFTVVGAAVFVKKKRIISE